LDGPFLLMIAGPNGAGKTTLFRFLRQNGVEFGEYINPDDIARELQGSYDERVRRAQVIADRRREACIVEKRSFSFETVMSHPSKIDILVRAKAAGFFVQLFFVGTDDPQTNIERVSLRVAQGGHDVPRDRIVSRWNRTMALLHSAIQASDRSFLFDNSAAGGVDAGPTLVFTSALGTEGHFEPSLRIRPPPIWLRQYVLDPLDINYSKSVA
jgi:predicted ABC-type ATPase